MMNHTRTPLPTVMRRADRGLSIAGTRLTLYDIMDYLKRDWPPRLIQHWFQLTEKQINDVMQYLETHRAEVEAEYQQVVTEAEELRRYYEAKYRERLVQIKAMPPKPGQEKIRAKLAILEARLVQEEQELATGSQ
jgi:uncharacterized protein (DUF433 family)